jgi:hypothetical protein
MEAVERVVSLVDAQIKAAHDQQMQQGGEQHSADRKLRR